MNARSAPALPLDCAALVCDQAQELERRIMLFFYPQAHTVSLEDLRAPGLLDLLKAFQQAVTDFESSARKDR